jgi:hypothetical protein
MTTIVTSLLGDIVDVDHRKKTSSNTPGGRLASVLCSRAAAVRSRGANK